MHSRLHGWTSRLRTGTAAGLHAGVLIGLLLGLGATRGVAQIPDTFTNLKVLPSDISRAELVSVMRGFAFALGARCNHCHVGDNPNDLTGYDFASDEKETKRVARAMIKMRSEINGRLIPATGRENAREVQCVTCHHGLSRPATLDGELLEVLRAEGVEAAEARYRDLRAEYYGRAAYDFGQGSLNRVAETLLDEGDIGDALTMIQLNIEYNPEEPYPYMLRAQALLQAGDREGAIASIEAALELDPENEFYRTRLQRLRGGPR